jgi:hypothetical protein
LSGLPDWCPCAIYEGRGRLPRKPHPQTPTHLSRMADEEPVVEKEEEEKVAAPTVV